MNNIYCIRHGWSDHNEAFLKSDYDEKVFESKKFIKSRLTEKGLAQARMFASQNSPAIYNMGASMIIGSDLPYN